MCVKYDQERRVGSRRWPLAPGSRVRQLRLAWASLFAMACAKPVPAPLGRMASPPHVSATTVSSEGDATAPLASAASSTAELEEPGAFGTVELEGLPEPVVWRPTAPRQLPWIVVAHGAGGTPEDHCAWTVQRAVEHLVICLRGLRTHRDAESYYYPEHFTLERIFSAALAALDLVSRSDLRRGIYAGYSQGATMGALMLVEHGDVAPRLLLIEGGYSWSSAQARRFRRTGGERVYFACGTPRCRQGAEESARQLLAAGVEVQIGYAEGAGHRADGAVGDSAETGLQWLLSAVNR